MTAANEMNHPQSGTNAATDGRAPARPETRQAPTGTPGLPENELRYVYAVTRPFEGVLPEEGGRGLDGEPPRLLHHGDLVAVVSPVPAEDFDEAPLKAHLEDLDWLAETARTHQRVITALTTLTSPLPLRLATICRDDSGVRRLLESGRTRFVSALDRLDGRVEWGVKVYTHAPPPAAPSPESAPAPSPDAPGAGRSYLQQRLAHRRTRETAANRADAVCRRLQEELSRSAEHTVLHRLQDGRLSGRSGQNVLNAAFLVPRADSEAFVERVRALTPGDDESVKVELTGPWAPYSFTDIGEEEPT
ncbi:GvpL/GvpF family gas vesicle protein [Streptomyces sp. CA-294286]|uniref:GvpL/GvpF family gas vesicle protein n=1 Tax=Streptomyces sp. CA-294286 TaxID=3240070 RepID=UPI003D8C8F14